MFNINDLLTPVLNFGLALASRSRSPRTKGNLVIPGLHSTVEILRDPWGVPHLYAEGLRDLLYAQGFVHAQDRLFQMDIFRRLAAGTLSEIMGKPGLAYDRSMRTLMLGRMARQQSATMNPETRANIEAYAAGINAFIEHESLPIEYLLLRCRPVPWSPADSLGWAKLMSWELSLNWTNEILRAQLANRLGPDLARGLWPDYPERWKDIAPSIEINPDRPGHPETKDQPAGEKRGRIDPPFSAIPDAGMGSNNWVVDGRRSTTGKPILANDMHLTMIAPAIWYENHLSAPEVNVTGITFPGIPGVVAGHNDRVAWGFTNGFIDVQDLYYEHLRQKDGDRLQAEFKGDWYDVQVVDETIHVRDAKDESERVVVTRHGPIINSLLPKISGDQPLALKWASQDEDSMFDGLFQMNKARDCHEFHAALSRWSAPVQNVVYADTQGNIAYSLAGRVPIRKNGDGRMPSAGWTGECEWNGYLSPDRLPFVLNPEQGFLASANNRTVSDDYPHYLGFDTLYGDRAQRIGELLTAQPQVDLAYIKHMQYDQISPAARSIAHCIVEAIGANPQFTGIISLLRAWDGSLSVDSPEAAIYEVFIRRLATRMLSRRLTDDPSKSSDGLEKDHREQPVEASLDDFYRSHGPILTWLQEVLYRSESHWFDLGNGETRSMTVQRALEESIAFLNSRLGSKMEDWTWGRLHQMTFHHPMGTVGLLQKFFNRGPFQVGGDGTTLWAAQAPGYHLASTEFVGPPYRMIVDLGDLRNSISLLAPGQSGQPTSRHYDDQIQPWLKKQYHPMLFTREDVESQTVERLRLVPRK